MGNSDSLYELSPETELFVRVGSACYEVTSLRLLEGFAMKLLAGLFLSSAPDES
jgi:hypothetical protein